MQRTPLSVLDNRAVTLPHPLPHGVRGIELVVVSSIFLALAVLAVGARLYRRIYIRRWLGADDALISIALVRVCVCARVAACLLLRAVS